MGGVADTLSWFRRTGMAFVVLFCLSWTSHVEASTRPLQPPGDVAVARVQKWSTTLEGYARVAPISLVNVRAMVPGALTHLSVVPGTPVAKGQVVAEVDGSRMRAFMMAREQAFRSARVRAATASQALAIVQRKFAHQLATRQDVNAARSELAAAQADLNTTQAQLRETRDMQRVRAPFAETVMSVQSANGEQIRAGESVLTLLPTRMLWIRAMYYGADAAELHVGMTGRFRLADGSDAVQVKIMSVASSVAADGGRRIGLLPVAPASMSSFIDGQWGSVTLDGLTRQGVVVPTSALVLDRGRWWVLVRTAKGDKPQPVVPGATQGWHTRIVSGLRPGERVVVKNVFLEYHRDIAQSYQPPD